MADEDKGLGRVPGPTRQHKLALFDESKRRAKEQREHDERVFRANAHKFLHEYLSLINLPKDQRATKNVLVPPNFRIEASRQMGWMLTCTDTGIKAKVVLSIVPDLSSEDLPLKPK